MKIVLKEGYSRYPIYEGSIDEIIGIVHAKDIVANHYEKSQKSLRDILRPAFYITEGKTIDTLLREFQKKKVQMAIVISEFGGTRGVVTLEDILEEVVGEFTTHIAEQNSEEIQPQPDGSFLVDGSINLRDLNREMQLNLPTDGPKTLNGLVLEYLEEIPQANLDLFAKYKTDIEKYSMAGLEILLPV